VEINGTGTFRPVTPVVFLRIDKGYQDCVALHSRLNQAELVSASPFEFHPHVTLAHAVPDEHLDRAQQMLRTYRASFLVDHIDLYEGDENGQWHVRERIAFAGDDRP
jgi:2'-5' RNA ligase